MDNNEANFENPAQKISTNNKTAKTLIFRFGAIIFLIFALIFLLIVGYVVKGFFDLDGSVAQEQRVVAQKNEIISPTPFPFQEMTIPYLRDREYSSNLGDLEMLSSSNSYTSYLTSYDSDGLRVNGLLTLPSGEMPSGGWPAIVFVHGYIPPKSYETTSNYSDYVDYLSRNGFVVFKIDLRGHGQSEGEAGGGYYSADYIIDTLNARAALAASDFVSAKRIGLWGHSMAGNVLLRSMAAQTDIPAIVIWAGAVYTYSDMQEYGIDDNSYRPPPQESARQRRREELFEKHGRFDPQSEFWSQVAATNYLGDIEGAIQLNHAVDDGVVSVGYSRNLAELLSESGVEYELHEYSSGGHNINGASFNSAMENTVEFFHENL